MDYDPIKDRLSGIFNRTHLGRRAFYRLLDLVFLRAWYVHRELSRILAILRGRKSVSSRGESVQLDVLDAGTGLGQYTYYLARTEPRARIDALDVKEDYLASARAFMARAGYEERVHFRQEDLTRLSASEAYDLILCVDVMEHIEEDELVLRNFFRAVRTGGYVVINTPSDQGGSDVRAPGAEGFIGEHVRDGYSKQDLEAKLRRAGFEIDASRYTYGKAGSFAWRILIKYPMKMLSSIRASLVLMPLYYVPVLPLGLLLNAVDVRGQHARGTGLIVVARKPAPEA